MERRVIFVLALIGHVFMFSGCGLPEDCTITPDQAVSRANILLSLEKTSPDSTNEWGESVAVEYDASTKSYAVLYATEPAEIDLLGERAIDVNCQTGVATFTPRE